MGGKQGERKKLGQEVKRWQCPDNDLCLHMMCTTQTFGGKTLQFLSHLYHALFWVFFSHSPPWTRLLGSTFKKSDLSFWAKLQNRRISREDRKYAFDEIFIGHFWLHRKAANFCHPDLKYLLSLYAGLNQTNRRARK